jgi:hypothetical protein
MPLERGINRLSQEIFFIKKLARESHPISQELGTRPSHSFDLGQSSMTIAPTQTSQGNDREGKED